MNEVIVVERLLPAPTTMGELHARERSCLDQNGVTSVCTFVAADNQRSISIYRAPDIEAVRETQRQAQLAFEHAWAAEVRGDARPAVHDVIVLQREFAEPQKMSDVDQGLSRNGPCFAMHRAEIHTSYLALDGRRMVCTFTAPDAESVRIANRQGGVPFIRAWTASMH